jgi:DNA-directed RNA polymerase specialized sigma24 family protein
VAEQRLVDLYGKVCEEQALDAAERRRLWFAISAEINRVTAEIEDPEHATAEEIRAVFERLGVPTIAELASRARRQMLTRKKRSPLTKHEPWADDPKEALALYWKTVEELVARSQIRLRAEPEEADTVESRVKEKLFKNDCEIVRRFRHESSFRSYLNIIVQRTFADLQVERFGKWHYSAVARSLGSLAMDLERMIYREGYAPIEAIAALLTSHPETSQAKLESLLAMLPVKQRRAVRVTVEDVAEMLPAIDPDILMITGARFRLSEKVATVIGQFIAGLEDIDRLLLQLLFESDLQISRIAVILQREQKALYRRRDELFNKLRKELKKAGIERQDAADLYGYISDSSDFGFGKKKQ